MGKHRHQHLNVKKSMSRENITHDMETAFACGDDTIGMCELETAWHHHEFKRCASKHNYGAVLGGASGTAAGALGIAVKATYGSVFFHKAYFCAPSMRHVSPKRYALLVKINRHADTGTTGVLETHQWSSGWTGSHSLDAVRKAHWYVGMKVVQRVVRRNTKYVDLHIGGGDLNRPPYTWPKGKVLGSLLSKTGMLTAIYAHTDHTHGSVTFDYIWVLSKKVKAKISKWSTPSYKSDHDGIRVLVEW